MIKFNKILCQIQKNSDEQLMNKEHFAILIYFFLLFLHL